MNLNDFSYHKLANKNFDQNAFTLAEVLITLGVIGVVAAMTMPVLVRNYNDKVLDTQSKKAQTVLANGIKMLMAKEDVMEAKNITLASCTTSECISKEMHKVFNIINEIKPDGKNAPEKYKFENGEFPIWSDSNLAYGFITNDGMMIGIKKFEAGAASFTFVADLNGNKSPNTGAKDLCKYTVTNAGTLTDQCASMMSCGGTAFNPSKHFSWGMPSAMAAPEYGDNYDECVSRGGVVRTSPNGKCQDGEDKVDTYYNGDYCCVPASIPSSCF